MAYDFKIDPQTNDLASGYVTGTDEVLQRVRTRLRREYGEWFLNTEEGIPWVGENGNGILGSKYKRRDEVLLLIRRCITNTEGVKRIIKLNTTYQSGDRSVDIYALLVLDGDVTAELQISFGLDV